ncbi:hypothetical protein [[Pantoea] beijingensis]|nr:MULTISPECIES: hypothetical protein [Erwiniaceae]
MSDVTKYGYGNTADKFIVQWVSRQQTGKRLEIKLKEQVTRMH